MRQIICQHVNVFETKMRQFLHFLQLFKVVAKNQKTTCLHDFRQPVGFRILFLICLQSYQPDYLPTIIQIIVLQNDLEITSWILIEMVDGTNF